MKKVSEKGVRDNFSGRKEEKSVRDNSDAGTRVALID